MVWAWTRRMTAFATKDFRGVGVEPEELDAAKKLLQTDK